MRRPKTSEAPYRSRSHQTRIPTDPPRACKGNCEGQFKADPSRKDGLCRNCGEHLDKARERASGSKPKA